MNLHNFLNCYISQIDESDCGVACLAMILKHFGSNVSLAYLRNLAKTKKLFEVFERRLNFR